MTPIFVQPKYRGDYSHQRMIGLEHFLYHGQFGYGSVQLAYELLTQLSDDSSLLFVEDH
jgi:hypothetical protein